MPPGRIGFEDEDLHDASKDEGPSRAAPTPMLSHPYQNEVIDLTQDDSDDEQIDVYGDSEREGERWR
jgi:hypothetical protein